MLNLDLRGQKIAVTGADGRLGQHVVRLLAEQGATIAAIVLHEEDAARIPFPEDAEGWAFPCDVTDQDAVAHCFEAINRQFGGIDVLVHTVGGWATSDLQETTLEGWNNMMMLNLTSTFLCFREASRYMTGRKGRLIAIASAQGADRGRAGQAAYSAAKAGVIRLVEATAAEYQGHITAHAIAPSVLLADDGQGDGVRASEVANLCLYLCAGAGDTLNGATLRAYGLG